jgi:hypothetical protein
MADKKTRGKGWINPLEGLGVDTPPFIVAGTAVRFFQEIEKKGKEWFHDKERKAYRANVFRRYNWPDEAIAAFDEYAANMTPLEARKADKFSRDNNSEEEYDNFMSAKREQWKKKEIEAFINPPLSRRDINIKEQNMSDENFVPEAKGSLEETGLQPDQAMQANEEMAASAPEERAFLNAVHVRKIVMEALKEGTLSCLPGADGLADTAPAKNLVNGEYYHGVNLLYLKEHTRENKYPTAEYVTFDQVSRAQADNPAIAIRAGQKGVSLNISEFNEEDQKWENKTLRLFNVAQTTKPQVMKDWANQKQIEKAQDRLAYLQSQYGENYQPPEKQKGPGPEITCTSTEPGSYLAQYLAAVSLGGTFKASPEQVKEFTSKLENSVYMPAEAKIDKEGNVIAPKINQATGLPVTNPFKLAKISNEANRECKEILAERGREARQAQQEQKLERAQSKGISM